MYLTAWRGVALTLLSFCQIKFWGNLYQLDTNLWPELLRFELSSFPCVLLSGERKQDRVTVKLNFIVLTQNTELNILQEHKCTTLTHVTDFKMAVYILGAITNVTIGFKLPLNIINNKTQHYLLSTEYGGRKSTLRATEVLHLLELQLLVIKHLLLPVQLLPLFLQLGRLIVDGTLLVGQLLLKQLHLFLGVDWFLFESLRKAREELDPGR